MLVWIVNPFDNLPMEGFRPQRYWLMARAFVAAGHKVVYWTSDFSHATKQLRTSDALAQPRVRGGSGDGAIALKLVPTPPYSRNVSLARIRSHRRLARNWLAMAAAEERRPDLVVASLPPILLPVFARRFADSIGAKFVLDVQDDWPGTFYRLLPRALRFLGPVVFGAARHRVRRLLAGADLVTGCCEHYRRLAESAGAKNYYRAYLGIELASAAPMRPRCASAALALVYVGNLGRTYDLASVIAAIERIPDATLDIAGAGEGEALARKASSPRVRFHGYCSQERLSGLLAGADIGVVPMSPASCVGIPNKMADYSRAGLAIVSSLGGESGRLLARYHAGEEYAPGDIDSLVAAIGRIAADLDGYKAGSARMAQAEFDCARIYRDYIRRMEDVVAVRSPRCI